MILFLVTYYFSTWLTVHIGPYIPDLSSFSYSLDSIMVYIRFGCYFLPMDTLLSVFVLTMSILVIVVIMNLIKLIWDLIPFL